MAAEEFLGPTGVVLKGLLRAFSTLLVVCLVQPLLLALINPGFLLLYYSPLFGWSWLRQLEPFVPFLLVPFIATVVAAGIYLYRSKAPSWQRPFVLNALIFITFMTTAELYKDVLILAEVLTVPHDCLHIHSFLDSLQELGEFAPAHAVMIRGDVPYFWSYSELAFVEGQPRPWYTCPQPLTHF